MNRDDAIADLKATFGRVSEISLPNDPHMKLVVIDEAQPVPGTNRRTRIAFVLPPIIAGRPQQFVESHLQLPNGTQPANISNHQIGGELWKTWSLAAPWSPDRHTMSQLAWTVLRTWNR
jgi:hypothetical protein